MCRAADSCDKSEMCPWNGQIRECIEQASRKTRFSRLNYIKFIQKKFEDENVYGACIGFRNKTKIRRIYTAAFKRRTGNKSVEC